MCICTVDLCVYLCVCAHPHASAFLLRNFTGPHLMLKMDMDKTIVTEHRVVQKHSTHVHADSSGQASCLTQNQKCNFNPSP